MLITKNYKVAITVPDNPNLRRLLVCDIRRALEIELPFARHIRVTCENNK